MSELERGRDTFVGTPGECDAEEQALAPACEECDERIRSRAGGETCISCAGDSDE